MKCFLFVVFISLFYFGNAGKLPDTFKICKRSDPDLNACFKEAVQIALPLMKDGLPSLGVPSGEPLEVDRMTIDANTAAVNLKQIFTNVKIHGITESIIDDAKIKVDDKNFEAACSLTIPKIVVNAKYEFDGKILMLPLTGTGDCVIEFYTAKTQLTMKGETFSKKGKTYLKLNDLTVDIVPSEAKFRFDNLFNGDEALGKQMNAMINDNWKDLFGEVKDSYDDLLSGILKNVANGVFTKVPYNELLP